MDWLDSNGPGLFWYKGDELDHLLIEAPQLWAHRSYFHRSTLRYLYLFRTLCVLPLHWCGMYRKVGCNEASRNSGKSKYLRHMILRRPQNALWTGIERSKHPVSWPEYRSVRNKTDLICDCLLLRLNKPSLVAAMCTHSKGN